ncbi:MAG: preprotein translocase subunit SecE [Candidatus Wallbacteria bacterium]|nr:preprotein translocase subunit SecE [Candidatus Wallbacteria bacterium]
MFNDLKQFLEEVWREVRPDKGRVSWPTMKSIRMSTMVVMITSVMLSIYIFLCDEILRQTLGALLAVSK